MGAVVHPNHVAIVKSRIKNFITICPLDNPVNGVILAKVFRFQPTFFTYIKKYDHQNFLHSLFSISYLPILTPKFLLLLISK